MTQAVDTAHFTLLIRITKDAHGRPLPRYAQHEVLSVLLRDILSQLAQKPRGPFLFHLQLLVLQQRSKIANSSPLKYSNTISLKIVHNAKAIYTNNLDTMSRQSLPQRRDNNILILLSRTTIKLGEK